MASFPTFAQLKSREAVFPAKGICALYVFGSVTRGEAGAASDIDLSFDLEPDAKFSLFDQAQIISELTAVLGRKVDFVPRRTIHPYIRARVEAKQIMIFA